MNGAGSQFWQIEINRANLSESNPSLKIGVINDGRIVN